MNKPLPKPDVDPKPPSTPKHHVVALRWYTPTATPPSTPPMVMGMSSKTSLRSGDLHVKFERDPAPKLVVPLVPPPRWEMDNLEALPPHVLYTIWSMLVTSAAEFRLAFGAQGLKHRWEHVLGERHCRKPIMVRAW